MYTIPLTPILRGDSWSAQLLELGDLTGYDELYFTAKKSTDDTDLQARIAIELPGGLVRLNGAGSTAIWGAITIDNLALGNITLTLTPEATAQLIPTTLCYDVQRRDGAVVTTLALSTVTVSPDVTRGIT